MGEERRKGGDGRGEGKGGEVSLKSVSMRLAGSQVSARSPTVTKDGTGHRLRSCACLGVRPDTPRLNRIISNSHRTFAYLYDTMAFQNSDSAGT